MNVAQILQKKRESQELSDEEIQFMVDGYTAGRVPDYQMASFLAFVFCRGMSDRETQVLTKVMMESGQVLQWPKDGFYCDKHSTGGIGDKISLVLVPLVVSCGLRVPMISGRGLGHTGGTLDKLEAIEGFRVDLSAEAFRQVVAATGCAIVAQTADVCPADKKLYGLRDVTGTVPSLPLIVSSIMSKKLAEGVDGLVLDVKWGSGAFMKTHDDARHLARAMVAVGKLMNRKVTALITDMNQPLGRAVGNATEVQEVIDILSGSHAEHGELMEVTLALAAELLIMGGVAKTAEEAKIQLSKHLEDGTALRKFEEMAAAQGALLPLKLPTAAYRTPAPSHRSGFVTAIDSEAIGWAAIALGAGRRTKEDLVDLAVGFTHLAKIGERIEKGQQLALVHHNSPNVDAVLQALADAYTIAEKEPPARGPMIVERIE